MLTLAEEGVGAAGVDSGVGVREGAGCDRTPIAMKLEDMNTQ